VKLRVTPRAGVVAKHAATRASSVAATHGDSDDDPPAERPGVRCCDKRFMSTSPAEASWCPRLGTISPRELSPAPWNKARNRSKTGRAWFRNVTNSGTGRDESAARWPRAECAHALAPPPLEPLQPVNCTPASGSSETSGCLARTGKLWPERGVPAESLGDPGHGKRGRRRSRQ